MDYDYLEEIVLLFWDEEENFNDELTQDKIGKEFFKDVKLINSLPDLSSAVDSYDDPNQKFLLLVHLFSAEHQKGYFKFKNSKVLKEYPNINYYFISSYSKSFIYEDSGDKIKIDVFTYDRFQEKIGNMFIPQTKSEMLGVGKDSTDTIIKAGIFLSHSSKNSELVTQFRDLILQGGLGYDLDEVKCTSVEDHGIPGGVNISKDLREFLTEKMGLFIQFISKNYLGSRVCLNEEGAAWSLLSDNMFIPILIPPATSNEISWFKTNNKGIKLLNKSSLLNIYQDRKDFFGDVNVTHLHGKIEEFINKINDR